MTEKTRSPEYRLAQGALSGLRQDLFHDAFAYRPLPPLRADGPLVRRLPGERIRRGAVWLPHAVVLFVAFCALMLAGAAGSGEFFSGLLFGLVPAGAVAMTLIRPIGAWWVSILSTPFVSVLSGSSSDSPWSPGGFLSHLAVMVVVAARTRPRTAGWMWFVTAGYAVFVDAFIGRGYGTNAPAMLFTSAVALLVVSMFLIRRNANEEVAAQQTVTAVERDRRTLLEERTTIARELHDVVAHHMSVVAIQAEAAPYRVENPPEELERAFATIRENAVAALTELRRILGVVRAEDYEAPDAPQPMLTDLGTLLANVRDAGLETEKTITGAVRELPQGVELSAYRIIQEALSNALRHAPGSTARVEISYVLGGLGLRVVNTAPRGPAKPSPGAGHGITGMRERVTMLNGEMTAEPTEEGGYEVTAFIPVAVTPAQEMS
ncbi:two-component sensor histidine kinase [Streptomyces sp. ISL-10]|uniref:sensor histidine kinase n=1 Tax=Streptomyces sp. ISL-10 TaxID=2819172 RepID=UPI001BEABD02|nr:histidine kinase [Streptomyces sp. ISL-10]MBT2368077.1 two-component sensor histidine kinase [Streptomyces sp. ISL-10]